MARFCFHLRETETYELIEDVAKLRSEVGVLYLNLSNETILRNTLRNYDLTVHTLFVAKPHVFVSSASPLASKGAVSFEDLVPYLRLIGLNGYTICSGVISEELNGKIIVSVPLLVDDYMKIGYITNNKIVPGRFADLFIWALKRHTQTGDDYEYYGT